MVQDIDGKNLNLSAYKGKVVLIVNVASQVHAQLLLLLF
jgi:glutathione peroxidase-family protein